MAPPPVSLFSHFDVYLCIPDLIVLGAELWLHAPGCVLTLSPDTLGRFGGDYCPGLGEETVWTWRNYALIRMSFKVQM